MATTQRIPKPRKAATAAKSKAPAKRSAAPVRAAISEAVAVRNYLELVSPTPKRRGRQPSLASLDKRIAALSARIAGAPLLVRLDLVEERIRLEQEVKARANEARRDEITDQFVAVAGAYTKRKNISRAAWRELGVPASVLRRAGI